MLADGKLFAADERINRIQDMFFPIIKIIREETEGAPFEYVLNNRTFEVEIYLNDEKLVSYS
ncbi:MAG: HpaII family restriction endonuclease [Defluviitaleaceae bacterium]|nr:HpaII family restriction endonuclease [Defluviitaleaceae bacterium]